MSGAGTAPHPLPTQLPKTASVLRALRPPGMIKRLLFKTDQGNLAECGLRENQAPRDGAGVAVLGSGAPGRV